MGPHLLVDGGVHNNIPGIILHEKGFDKIIAINSGVLGDLNISLDMGVKKEGSLWKSLADYFNLPPIIHIIHRSIFIQGNLLDRNQEKYFDYVLKPDSQEFGLFDVHKIDEIIEVGRKAALKHLEQIKAALL